MARDIPVEVCLGWESKCRWIPLELHQLGHLPRWRMVINWENPNMRGIPIRVGRNVDYLNYPEPLYFLPSLLCSGNAHLEESLLPPLQSLVFRRLEFGCHGI